ncbi:hypothetical protein [Nostoc sp.]|uniref:hypothetical protein n=1 Tax=Nostoc sp. TaxID=1180 RepID=UPI002FF7337B
MGRRKTEAQLKAQLKYAEARKAYTPPLKEDGTVIEQRPSTKARYRVMSHPGADALYYTVRVPTRSLSFFAEGAVAELGLAITAGDSYPPKGFKPCQIHATKSTEHATSKKAKASGRTYASYSPTGGQSSYSAAVTSPENATGVATLVRAINTAKKEVLGPYGRIWFTPEFYVITE